MKGLIQFLVSFIPFLEPYPFWIKAFGSSLIILIAVFFVCLLFFRPHTPSMKGKEANGVAHPSTTQKHNGVGDIIGGDKYVFYGDTKLQQLPPEIRKVSLNYPSESGLQAELEAQGYKIRWSKEEMRAGWEPVVQTFEDGTRVMFKDSAGDLTLLKKKTEVPAHATTLVPQPALQEREFTTKTPHDLLALYKVLNPIAGSDALLNAFKGKWIKAEGKIVIMVPGAPDGNQAGIALRNNDDTIECRFGPQWKSDLSGLSMGDSLKVQGKIAPTQNASQLYLQECEILQSDEPLAYNTSDEKRLEIKDSEFKADIEDADKGSAMEVNQPAILSGVKASLNAKNVKDAAAFRTNQGIVSIVTTCPVYNRPVPFVMTGQPSQAPKTFTCSLCGQQHPLKIK